MVIGPIQSYGLSRLAPQDNPHGVTIFSTVFQIAGCVGASLFASAYSALTIGNTANNAFLIVGILVAVVSVIGFALAIALLAKRKSSKQKADCLDENENNDNLQTEEKQSNLQQESESNEKQQEVTLQENEKVENEEVVKK